MPLRPLLLRLPRRLEQVRIFHRRRSLEAEHRDEAAILLLAVGDGDEQVVLRDEEAVSNGVVRLLSVHEEQLRVAGEEFGTELVQAQEGHDFAGVHVLFVEYELLEKALQFLAALFEALLACHLQERLLR